MLGFDLKKISQLNRFKQQFEDLGEIGSGGFAEVHRVRHRLDRRIYAVKILKIKPSFNSEESEKHFQRILSEPQIEASLSHPNILQYNGCWMEVEEFTEQEKAQLIIQQNIQEAEFQLVVLDESYSSDQIFFGSSSSDHKIDKQENSFNKKISHQQQRKIGSGLLITDYKEIRIYVIAELCQFNLQSYLYLRNIDLKEKTLQPEHLLRNYQICLDMISGLSYLHNKRIIHRDIKLHNLMLDERGRCKLIDFGLAKRVKYWKTSIEDKHYLKFTQQQKTEDGDEKFSSSIGTKLFSSPEQANSQKYDFRTDIYSLAMVIVLMFDVYTTSHEQRDLLQKIRKRNLDDITIPNQLKHLLHRSLGQQNERPSLSELQKCLKELIKEIQDRDSSLYKKKSDKENGFVGQDKIVHDKFHHFQKHRIHHHKKMIDVKDS